jgi:hypothetical protein
VVARKPQAKINDKETQVMAGNVGLELGDDGGYRIRVGTDHSEVVPLGEGIEWRAPNGKLYLAFADLEGGSEEGSAIESEFEHYVYEARPVPEADVEEVEFGDEGLEGEDDEEDDAGDDDEDEEKPE